MKSIKLKINKDLPGYNAGTVVTIKTDGDGTPLMRFWRDRLRDAKDDDCVKIVEAKPASATKKESSKEDSK